MSVSRRFFVKVFTVLVSVFLMCSVAGPAHATPKRSNVFDAQNRWSGVFVYDKNGARADQVALSNNCDGRYILKLRVWHKVDGSWVSRANNYVPECETESFSLNPGQAAGCCYAVKMQALFYNKDYEYLGHSQTWYPF